LYPTPNMILTNFAIVDFIFMYVKSTICGALFHS